MDTKFYVDMEDLYGAHNYNPLEVILTQGKGVWVWDVEKNKYLDFLSAYSALNHGHCHPRLLKSLCNQAKNLTLTSRAFRNEQWPLLAKKLCDLTGYEMVLAMNSGAEAVETAIKAARMWGYEKKGILENQAEIITCENNFHGRTVAVISFSIKEQCKKDFGPFTPGFIQIPYGDPDELEKAITPNTAAFLVEPIQAEGGIIIPSKGYLRKAKQICKKNNVLFIADEIQTGLGRTGSLLACDHEEIKPDIVVIGKSLGGGYYAISATLSSREILGVFTPGSHGSTFGSNPLACAVAQEALRVMEVENFSENAEEHGKYFIKKLKTLKNRYINEVRGKGLLMGIELKPEAGGARRYCEALMKEGLLCRETRENVLRFTPPLIIKKRN